MLYEVITNKIMVAENLDLMGLHTHIGTYITTPNAYAVATSKLSDVITSYSIHYTKLYD